jgi:hypothetical protein
VDNQIELHSFWRCTAESVAWNSAELEVFDYRILISPESDQSWGSEARLKRALQPPAPGGALAERRSATAWAREFVGKINFSI